MPDEEKEPTSTEDTDPNAMPIGDNEPGTGEPEGSGAAQETPEGGSEAGEEPGGQPAIPHGPTGAELIEMLSGDVEAQQIIRQRLADGLTQAQETALGKAKQDQLQQLVKEERYDEIGRMFVEEQQTEAVRSEAEDAAMRQVYGDIYRRLFQHPVMKSLSAEERNLLDPRNFQDDATYVLALTAHIATKSEGQQRSELVKSEVNTTLEALKNIAAANTAANPSISGLPGAVGPGGGDKSSSDLIREGWAEQLAEASET